MIDEQGNVTLTNLELASTDSRSRERVGQRRFMSPQLFDGMEVDTHTNDVWAASTILFWMLAEDFLWYRATRLDNLFNLHSQHQLINTDNLNELSEAAVDLLNELFALDPEDRLTIEGILAHAWMNDTL